VTFSTRSNPKLGQSSVATTSLGAVGGARGTAAGALRIFVEFLTTYDGKEVDQLQNDIRQIEHAQNNANIYEKKRQTELGQVRHKLQQADLIMRGRLDASQRKELKVLEAKESSRSKTAKAEAATLRTTLAAGLRSVGLTAKETELVLNRSKLRERESVLESRSERYQKATVERNKRLVGQEHQLTRLQQVRAGFAPRLAGLAVGAIGGIFGGAVLGIGFTLAQTALENIGSAIQDLIDPSRHARESLKELADEVLKLADAKTISDLQAASEIVANFGVSDKALAGQLTGVLGEAAAQQRLIEKLEQEKKILDLLVNQKGVEADLRKKVAEVITEEARQEGTLHNILVRVQGGYRGASTAVQTYIGDITLEEAVTQRLESQLRELRDAALQAAAAQAQMAADASRATIAEEALSAAVASVVASRSAATDTAIENLGSGESARTRALQAKLDAAFGGGGGGGASRAAALRNIAEERALILLRQRLRLLGKNIDLEKYSGKFLLEAINAKINALQKEGAEQSRLNQLLDLQYRMSKTLRRQEGESIGDFLERRAQENRNMLAEQQDLERQALIDKLNDQKDAVQDEVQLAELAEQKKEALRQSGTSSYLKNLQKQLEASREADRKALEAKKKALLAEQAAFNEAAKKAVLTASAENQAKVRMQFSYVRSIQDIYKTSGLIQGQLSAKAFLKAFGTALIASGLMTPKQLAQLLKGIDSTLAAAYRAQSIYSSNAIHDLANLAGQFHGFQQGGIIPLNNSSSPFGQNVKVGEGGTELGVILSNRVTQALRDSQMAAEQIGPFNLYGSVDPLRDTYKFKRLVKEAVQEALRT